MSDATLRRDDFWRPFLLPGTVFDNEPDDGHDHAYHLISPASINPTGRPMGMACLKCGWFKAWAALSDSKEGK